MKTELQYQLQKARALATELRCTIAAIFKNLENKEFSSLPDKAVTQLADSYLFAGELEGFLDDLTDSSPEIMGEGGVKLEIEPNVQ